MRGAFTGAISEGRPGRFELANGGTLCLDEIGELPLDLQPFLLRALEEGVVYRLGDGQPRRVEVRLLAITNRVLLDEVAAGRFRLDLYHRISVTQIRPPPLRDRHGDVELLVAHFNAALAERHEVPQRRFGREVLSLFAAYHWSGNVRELRNVVESLLLMSDAPDVRLDELAAGAFVGAGRPAACCLGSARQPGGVRACGDHRRYSALFGQPDRSGKVAGRFPQHALPEDRALPAANLRFLGSGG